LIRAKLEREDRAPSLRIAFDLADALGVAVDDMRDKEAEAEAKPERRPRGRPAGDARDKTLAPTKAKKRKAKA